MYVSADGCNRLLESKAAKGDNICCNMALVPVIRRAMTDLDMDIIASTRI